MWRQWGAAGLALALLSGCGGFKLPFGSDGAVPGFFGGVAGDEPRAVLIGRDVLSAGGSAADAAVAVAFALTATMPSRASLGGGGVCIVHEPKAMKTEALDFMPRAPAAPVPAGGAPVAVPGMVRGLYALHARQGKLRWEEVVFASERLARFGFDVSRAFVRDVAVGGGALTRDSGAQAIFANSSGAPLAEGDRLRQLDLAAVLGRIRAEGPVAIYGGPGAETYAAGARAIGGSLTVEDLRDYRPMWRPTIKARVGSHVAHFAGPPVTGGLVAAELWSVLGEGGRWDGARADERAHLVAEATARLSGAPPPTLDSRGRIAKDWADRLMQGYDARRHLARPQLSGPAPDDGQSTGFVALDRDGGAVACAFTVGRMFGLARVVPGTGILAAAVPGEAAEWSLAPMIVVNENAKDTIATFAGSGDATAPMALVTVALQVFEERRGVDDAIAEPRAAHYAAIDATLVENSGDALAGHLAARGHRVGRVNTLARVNGAYCTGGVRRDAASCGIATDPRGLGLAIGADR